MKLPPEHTLSMLEGGMGSCIQSQPCPGPCCGQCHLPGLSLSNDVTGLHSPSVRMVLSQGCRVKPLAAAGSRQLACPPASSVAAASHHTTQGATRHTNYAGHTSQATNNPSGTSAAVHYTADSTPMQSSQVTHIQLSHNFPTPAARQGVNMRQISRYLTFS